MDESDTYNAHYFGIVNRICNYDENVKKTRIQWMHASIFVCS